MVFGPVQEIKPDCNRVNPPAGVRVIQQRPAPQWWQGCDQVNRTASKRIAKNHRFWFHSVMKPFATIMKRREFLKSMTAACAVGSQAFALTAAESLPTLSAGSKLPQRPLGRTGVIVRGLGRATKGQHLLCSHCDADDACRAAGSRKSHGLTTRALGTTKGQRATITALTSISSAKSMDKIAGLADLVVPGHDNWFLNKNLL